MENKKIEIFWLWAYLLICIQYPFQELSEPGIEIGQIFLHYFILGIFVLAFCHMLFSTASVVQSIIYKVNGYGFTPILIYPFIIGVDKKHPVQLFYDLYRVVDSILPKSMFIDKTKSNQRDISLVVKKASQYAFVSQQILGMAAIIVSILSRKYYVAVAFAILVYSFYILAKMDTFGCKGLLTFSKYAGSKYFVIFLAQQAILYTNEESQFYELLEEIVCEKIPEELILETLIAVKHIYMIKCVDEKFAYPNAIKDVVREQLVIKKFSEFSDIDIGEAKFELLKVCICYSILRGDEEMKDWLTKILRKMVEEEKFSFVNFETTQRYLDLVEGRNFNIGKKNRPLRKQQFYRCFLNYRENDNSIIREIV